MIAWLRRNTLCRLNRHGEPILEGLDLPNGLCMSTALCPHCRAELKPRVNARLWADDYGQKPSLTIIKPLASERLFR